MLNLKNVLKQLDYDSFLEGWSWYKEAHAWACEVSDITGHPLEVVCAVLACVSPAVRWDINKRDAYALLSSGTKAHKIMISSYGLNKTKAIKIMETGDTSILSGKKVVSFYHNILNPECPKNITIDRHAYRAYKQRSGSSSRGAVSLTPKKYDLAGKAYKKLANRISKHLGINLTPNQVQALVWIKIR